MQRPRVRPEQTGGTLDTQRCPVEPCSWLHVEEPHLLEPCSLVGALSLPVGWVAGRSASTRQSGRRRGARAAEPRPARQSAGDAPLTRQLRERLDAQPARVPAEGRNPFVFGASARRAASRADREERAAGATSPAPRAGAVAAGAADSSCRESRQPERRHDRVDRDYQRQRLAGVREDRRAAARTGTAWCASMKPASSSSTPPASPKPSGFRRTE